MVETLDYNADRYNSNFHTVSFLSRSPQESGLSKKGKKEELQNSRQKKSCTVKATENL
jgi:hypothetical protein